MKTMSDPQARLELINRIQTLNEHSQPQWGKMNVSQMIRHCIQWEEMAAGHKAYKQSLLGKLFGKTALRNMLKDEPMKKGLPTVPSFKQTGNTDVTAEKLKWIALLNSYTANTHHDFIHPFFGKVSKEQAALMAYKHTDHHLKQFGV